MAEDKREPGRPSLYKPEYCDRLIEHMSEGLSYEAFAGVIRVAKQTLYDWEKVHPEFLDAKSVGVDACRLFWEKLGRDNIINRSESEFQGGSWSKSLNSQVWSLNMKNRFGWRDKQPGEADVIVNNLTSKTDEELEARMQELMAKQGNARDSE